MDLKQSQCTERVEYILAMQRSLGKDRPRIAGKFKLVKQNDRGKVRKVYKYLKIVYEVSGAKEIDDEIEEKCQIVRKDVSRSQTLLVESRQGESVDTVGNCEYSGYSIQDFFGSDNSSKQEFSSVFKKCHKALKRLSRGLYEHQLEYAGLCLHS